MVHRLVMVDDSRDLRAMVRSILRPHATIEVVGDTADPDAAVALVQQKRADIVLLDLNLGAPKGGREILAQLRQLKPRVTVVILSAYSGRQIRAELLDAGADGF